MSDKLTQRRTLILRGSEWYRGKGSIDSALIVEHANGVIGMCCLGLAMTQLFHMGSRIEPNEDKYPESVAIPAMGPIQQQARAFQDALLERVDMDRVPENCPVRWGRKSHLGRAIGILNDTRKLDDETRVKLLEPLFDQLGITLIFRPEE